MPAIDNGEMEARLTAGLPPSMGEVEAKQKDDQRAVEQAMGGWTNSQH